MKSYEKRVKNNTLDSLQTCKKSSVLNRYFGRSSRFGKPFRDDGQARITTGLVRPKPLKMVRVARLELTAS